MSYNIEGAISYCNYKYRKDRTQIRNEIVTALGMDPSNKNDVTNFYNKLSGRTKGLTAEEFRAICKVCRCPAHVLADTEK